MTSTAVTSVSTRRRHQKVAAGGVATLFLVSPPQATSGPSPISRPLATKWKRKWRPIHSISSVDDRGRFISREMITELLPSFGLAFRNSSTRFQSASHPVCRMVSIQRRRIVTASSTTTDGVATPSFDCFLFVSRTEKWDKNEKMSEKKQTKQNKNKRKTIPSPVRFH